MKDRSVATVLALLLGGIGMHRFYLGKTVSGVFYFLFFWTFIPALIAFFEGLSYAFMSDDDFNRHYNEPNQARQTEKVPGHIVLREHLPTDSEKQCPDCAEMVKAAAKKCRFCGHAFAA